MDAQNATGGEVVGQDIAVRDELIAAQESLLNVYRCRFNVDAEVVVGGCASGEPRRGPVAPGEFAGTPSPRELARRDGLVAEQESLLNVYRCQFGIDLPIVLGGCAAFQEQRLGDQVAALVLKGANEVRRGQAPLGLDPGLSAAARGKARAQAEANDWLHEFDFGPLLGSDWGIWFAGRSSKVGTAPGAAGLESTLSELLLSGPGDDRLRCEMCSHLGVGVAFHQGWTFATVVVAAPAPTGSGIVTAEAEMADLVNELRRELGLNPLANHDGVAAVARRWSQTMAASQDFRHNPNYTQQYPSGWRLVGENIALIPRFGSLSEAVRHSFNNLVDSPGHYATMVNPDFNHIGVGIAVGPSGFYVTQNFALYPASTPQPPVQDAGEQDSDRGGNGLPAPTVTLSRGRSAQGVDKGCTTPSCHYLRVELVDFEPGTYTVHCGHYGVPSVGYTPGIWLSYSTLNPVSEHCIWGFTEPVYAIVEDPATGIRARSNDARWP